MKIPMSKTRLEITILESHPDLPGANELSERSSCHSVNPKTSEMWTFHYLEYTIDAFVTVLHY